MVYGGLHGKHLRSDIREKEGMWSDASGAWGNARHFGKGCFKMGTRFVTALRKTSDSTSRPARFTKGMFANKTGEFSSYIPVNRAE